MPVTDAEKEKVAKNSNNNDSSKNFNLTKESPLYYAPTERMEESYSTTRQRVFMHNKN